jgi:hypothetical protein
MASAVLRCGHACTVVHMPTLEYQRGHGTQKRRCDKPRVADWVLRMVREPGAGTPRLAVPQSAFPLIFSRRVANLDPILVILESDRVLSPQRKQRA